MDDLTSSIADHFSLTRAGLFHRLESRLVPERTERSWVARRAINGIAIGYLPLLLLSLVQGLALNPHLQIPFLHDIAAPTRFLIALPILIFSELGIDHRLRHVVRYFLKSRLVQAGELASFEAVLLGIERLRDRILPEIIFLVLAYLPSLKPRDSDFFIDNITSWHTIGTGSAQEISYAGWWFVLVSVPWFRFLLLRWAWRITLWAVFIWRVTHLKLHLVATHTDSAGGLGFLAEAQGRFSPIVFAGGVTVAGAVGNAIVYEGATIDSVKYILIGYVIAAMLALIAPLVLAAPKLIEVRKHALFEYGALVTAHNQAFQDKWLHPEMQKGAGILGDPDASSLADLGGSFNAVREMRPVPFDRRMFGSLALAAALPMLPIIIMATPANEVLSAVLAMLG